MTNWLDPTLKRTREEGTECFRLYWPESGCMAFGDLIRYPDGMCELHAWDADHRGMVWYIDNLAPVWQGQEVIVKAQLRTDHPYVD